MAIVAKLPQREWVETPANSSYASVSTVKYVEGGNAGGASSASEPAAAVSVDLLQYVIDGLVPGGLRFTFAGDTYVERDGTLYRSVSADNNAGVAAGSVDYGTAQVSITDWDEGEAAAIAVQAMLTRRGDWDMGFATFRTAGAPLRVASLQVNAVAEDGTPYNATSDNNGDLTDGTGVVVGTVDYENGIADIAWVLDDNSGDPDPATWTYAKIVPSSLEYNAVVITYLPIDEEIIGLNTTRLPLDGRVPIYESGRILVIFNEDVDALPSPLGQSQTESLSRTNLAAVRFEDQDGQRVPDAFFDVDLAAGEVTTAADLDLTGYNQPIKAYHRIEDMRICTDAEINGTLRINRGLSRDFPVPGSYVSSAVFLDTLQARVANAFTQKVWGNAWADDRVGDDSVAKYDDINYPIAVSNRGAVSERWAIVFTGATTFNVVAETRGIVATGNTSTDLTVTNPLTNEPYFQLQADGWGTGWITNNVLRFNTIGAVHPLWMARCVLPGPTALDDDSGRLEVRGDAD